PTAEPEPEGPPTPDQLLSGVLRRPTDVEGASHGGAVRLGFRVGLFGALAVLLVLLANGALSGEGLWLSGFVAFVVVPLGAGLFLGVFFGCVAIVARALFARAPAGVRVPEDDEDEGEARPGWCPDDAEGRPGPGEGDAIRPA